MAKVMIVEDDALIADDLLNCLTKAGHTVTSHVTSGEAACVKVGLEKPDVILMDIKLDGGLDGIESASIIKRRNGVPVIYITAYSNERFLERSKTTEPINYILKPYNEKELLDSIEKSLTKK